MMMNQCVQCGSFTHQGCQGDGNLSLGATGFVGSGKLRPSCDHLWDEYETKAIGGGSAGARGPYGGIKVTKVFCKRCLIIQDL